MKPCLLLFAGIGLVVLLTGCPEVSDTANAPISELATNGDLIHLSSGMRFPATCADFTRTGIHPFNAAGTDISCGYNFWSETGAVAVTVYVYPTPPVRSFGSPDSVIDDAKRTVALSEFRKCQSEIVGAHPDAQLLGESACPAPNGSPIAYGHFADYSFRDDFARRTQPVESWLYIYCFVDGRWTVMYRITAPAGGAAVPRIQRFLGSYHWTVGQPRESEPASGAVRP